MYGNERVRLRGPETHSISGVRTVTIVSHASVAILAEEAQGLGESMTDYPSVVSELIATAYRSSVCAPAAVDVVNAKELWRRLAAARAFIAVSLINSRTALRDLVREIVLRVRESFVPVSDVIGPLFVGEPLLVPSAVGGPVPPVLSPHFGGIEGTGQTARCKDGVPFLLILGASILLCARSVRLPPGAVPCLLLLRMFPVVTGVPLMLLLCGTLDTRFAFGDLHGN